jgi:hypothetical protein
VKKNDKVIELLFKSFHNAKQIILFEKINFSPSFYTLTPYFSSQKPLKPSDSGPCKGPQPPTNHRSIGRQKWSFYEILADFRTFWQIIK